jgi:hypothetical protein
MAASPTGDVYVSDGKAGGRIVEYTVSGRFICQWSLRNSRARSSSGVAIDAQGNVYAGVGTNVKKYTSSGSLIASWPASSDAKQKITDLTIGADRVVYVLLSKGASAPPSVARFGQGGAAIGTWPLSGAPVSLLDYQRGLAVAGGTVFVDTQDQGVENLALLRFQPDGIPLGPFPLPVGISSGMSGVAADDRGNIYVPGVLRSIDKYAVTGAHRGTHKLIETYDSGSVDIARSGKIYVLASDSARRSVQGVFAPLAPLTRSNSKLPKLRRLRARPTRVAHRNGRTVAKSLALRWNVNESVQVHVTIKRKALGSGYATVLVPDGGSEDHSGSSVPYATFSSDAGGQRARVSGRFPAGKYKVVVRTMSFAGKQGKSVRKSFEIH